MSAWWVTGEGCDAWKAGRRFEDLAGPLHLSPPSTQENQWG